MSLPWVCSLVARLFPGLIQRAGFDLYSPSWHRTRLLERPSVLNYHTCPIRSCMRGMLQALSLRELYLMCPKSWIFSDMVPALWNILLPPQNEVSSNPPYFPEVPQGTCEMIRWLFCLLNLVCVGPCAHTNMTVWHVYCFYIFLLYAALSHFFWQIW